MELLENLHSFSAHAALIFTSIVLYLVYTYRVKFNYWSDRGVPSQTTLQSLKRSLRLLLRIDSFTDNYYDIYKDLDGLRYGGTFELSKPELMVRDPELVKMVLIKGFSSFTDRVNQPADDKLDPISIHLFNLQGEKWKQVRQKMTTAFSSAKLNMLFGSLKQSVKDMNAYLETLVKGNGSVEVEAQSLMSHYTLDVIGASAMGVKCNSIQDGDTEFIRATRDFFRFDARRTIFTLLEQVHPKLPSLVGWKQLRSDVEEFFISAIRTVAALKESEAAARKDFLQILIDVQKAEKREAIESKILTEQSDNSELVFTDHIIAGLIGSFFSAGFEPTAATLTFCIYELAKNPGVQQKFFEEIQEVKKRVGDELEYENLKEFKYANQVIDETLRMYPAAGMLTRLCTEPFKLDSSLVVEPKVKVIISVYGLHMNPEYFPEPEKFDPERFSEENKGNIVPGTYLPFGDGPRICIAMRFALMDVKTMLIDLVSRYEIQATSKTPSKLQFDPTSFTVVPKQDVWLRLQKRS